jgi:hypothetical protein
MKRVVVGHYGGPEVLQAVEVDDPRPGAGDVLVRALAAVWGADAERAPPAHRSTPSARAAGELGGDGKLVLVP